MKVRWVCKAILICAWMVCVAGAAAAQENHHESRLGLSRAKILAMKPEDWAEYYNKKNERSEAGYDEAYRTYAECLSERSEPRLAKLYKAVQGLVRKYRTLCGKFRVDNLSLQQAYAGGGTLYSHAMERGEVEDEQLVEKLVKQYSDLVGPAPKRSWRTSLANLRRRILRQNPAMEKNRKQLAEFKMGEQGATGYKDLIHDLDAIDSMLRTERPSVVPTVVKFLVEEGKSFNG